MLAINCICSSYHLYGAFQHLSAHCFVFISIGLVHSTAHDAHTAAGSNVHHQHCSKTDLLALLSVPQPPCEMLQLLVECRSYLSRGWVHSFLPDCVCSRCVLLIWQHWDLFTLFVLWQTMLRGERKWVCSPRVDKHPCLLTRVWMPKARCWQVSVEKELKTFSIWA